MPAPWQPPAAPAAAPHRGSQRGRQCALHGGLLVRGDLHQLPATAPAAPTARRRSPRRRACALMEGASRRPARRTICAQVFAAMGYDGWALNAADIAMGR